MTESPDDAAISVRGLTKTFSGRRTPEVTAVDRVDLDVERGQMFGFLGPNGAGKSTLVRMLCTLTKISAGTARVAGLDVATQAPQLRRRIGVALQDVGLDPRQSGRELLTLQGGLQRIADPTRRAAQLLEVFRLEEPADRPLATWSGGMRRRLDLATALVHEPEVLFLDEPTTGLDPESRQEMWAEVRRINQSGTTVFLTTQYLEEADQLCPRVAIIDRGRLVADGAPTELKSQFGHDALTIVVKPEQVAAGSAALEPLAGPGGVVTTDQDHLRLYVADGAATLAEAMRLLLDRDITPGSVTVTRPSLDDVYLAATGRMLDAPTKAVLV